MLLKLIKTADLFNTFHNVLIWINRLIISYFEHICIHISVDINIRSILGLILEVFIIKL